MIRKPELKKFGIRIARIPTVPEYWKHLKLEEFVSGIHAILAAIFLFLLIKWICPNVCWPAQSLCDITETGLVDCRFQSHCFEETLNFFLIGVLCGLAIYNFTIINVPFPLALYKKLLGEVGPAGLGTDDLEGLSPLTAKGVAPQIQWGFE